jgi:hypothetical protein
VIPFFKRQIRLYIVLKIRGVIVSPNSGINFLAVKKH